MCVLLGCDGRVPNLEEEEGRGEGHLLPQRAVGCSKGSTSIEEKRAELRKFPLGWLPELPRFAQRRQQKIREYVTLSKLKPELPEIGGAGVLGNILHNKEVLYIVL